MIVRIDRWLGTPAPAERLAALRVLVCGFVVVYFAVTVGEFDRLASRAATEFEPIGLIGVLDAPVAPWIVWAMFGGLAASGVAALVGFRFQVSGPIFALLALLWASYHSSWGQMLHFEHLFTIHLLLLAASPAADVWSIDERRGRTTSASPSSRYGWPIRLMALATVITYLISGIAKLRMSGLSWVDGTTLQNHIAYSATRLNLLGGFEPPLAEFVVTHGWLLAPMAIGALAIELMAPIALLGRSVRVAWVLAALAMHIGTAATMLVWFPYQGLGFAFLALFLVDRKPHDERLVPMS